MPDVRVLMYAAWATAGLAGFFWIGWEDPTPLAVILIAGLISLAWTMTLINQGRLPAQAGLMRWILLCSLLGAAVGPLASTLMVVKTGLHGHVPPDFTLEDVLDALRLIPVWGASGGLLGLAGWLGIRMSGSRRPR